jgi:GNAT superfamily N-acetyltransferase
MSPEETSSTRNDEVSDSGSRSSGHRPDVVVRQATLADVSAIYQCQIAAYSALPVATLCDERMLRLQIEAFPEGQLVAIADSRIVGYAFALIVQLDESSPWYSYAEITGGGTFSTHDPSGDTLYGADIAVHPDYRGRRISQYLYDGRREILRRFNLRRMVAGGRIPGYSEHAGRMTPEEYVEKVTKGELKDRALGTHLRAGYEIRGVHMGYLRDAQSLDYATFLEMVNPSYQSA